MPAPAAAAVADNGGEDSSVLRVPGARARACVCVQEARAGRACGCGEPVVHAQEANAASIAAGANGSARRKKAKVSRALC